MANSLLSPTPALRFVLAIFLFLTRLYFVQRQRIANTLLGTATARNLRFLYRTKHVINLQG